MKKVSLVSIFLVLFSIQACAPVFSDLQSARLVGKGKVEVTPSYSSVSFTEGGESNGLQNHVGAQLAIGVSDKTDLRLRFEHVWLKDDGSYNEQVLGIGPKFSLLENRIAAYLPVGLALSDTDTFEFQPTLLFTLPVVQNRVDFNPALKYIIPTCSGCESLVALNLGFALSDDISRWAFRTEYGMLYNPGEDGHYSQFSFGLSVILGKHSISKQSEND